MALSTSSCRGCGTMVDPTEHEVNTGVDEILHASLKDAVKHGEICPLCGHSKAVPISNRKSIQFGILLLVLLIVAALALSYFMHQNTERQAAALEGLKQVESNPLAAELLGTPVQIQGSVKGDAKQDETGWHEIDLTIPVRGPKATGVIRISGGRESGPWKFTTEELIVPELKKQANLLTGKIVEFSPGGYQDIHTEAVSVPSYVSDSVPPPSWDGNYPCVFADATSGATPQLGSCTPPIPMSPSGRASVDRFETDLRTGDFSLRQTDLLVSEAGFDLPLTRGYSAQFWMSKNRSQAFGLHGSLPYNIAPQGTRNPYTEQFIVLENGDFLYFPRVSAGTGYSDAIYRHSETGTSFYGATQQWDGNGWLTTLRDGSTIHFPESYSAKNLAQGAPIDMTDASGNKIELVRSPSRNLLEIRGPNGTSIKLSYDSEDRIVRAEDGHGKWTAYGYNGEGFLTNVWHSSGTGRFYYYENDELTWVKDENSRALVHNIYSNGWIIDQSFGNGRAVHYDYQMASNHHYPIRVTVTLPDGSVKAVDPSHSVSEVYKRMK
jgi:YD repeat-containing protein